jgi:hypothetical protein
VNGSIGVGFRIRGDHATEQGRFKPRGEVACDLFHRSKIALAVALSDSGIDWRLGGLGVRGANSRLVCDASQIVNLRLAEQHGLPILIDLARSDFINPCHWGISLTKLCHAILRVGGRLA